jgi:hypothetical protein
MGKRHSRSALDWLLHVEQICRRRAGAAHSRASPWRCSLPAAWRCQRTFQVRLRSRSTTPRLVTPLSVHSMCVSPCLPLFLSLDDLPPSSLAHSLSFSLARSRSLARSSLTHALTLSLSLSVSLSLSLSLSLARARALSLACSLLPSLSRSLALSPSRSLCLAPALALIGDRQWGICGGGFGGVCGAPPARSRRARPALAGGTWTRTPGNCQARSGRRLPPAARSAAAPRWPQRLAARKARRGRGC